MSRSRVPISQLKAISREHISYEISMFIFTAAEMRSGKLSDFQMNVMLESFLLHARCLLDFLYPPKSFHPDDVIAEDFFNNPRTLLDVLPAFLPISSYLRLRTGKEVAHLTYGRLKVTTDEKIWNYGEVHKQIVGALSLFFEQLTEEQRRWFTTIVKK